MTNFTHNLAIAIGINQYQNTIAELKTAKHDAKKVADIFRDEYQYQVELITDDTERKPTLEELKNLLKELPEKLQPPAENNRLLFYFAGHGMSLESDDGPRGFLLPQDADPKDSKTFLPMQVLHDALVALPCHHLLLILDCCFAGTFRWASTRKMIPIPETIHREHYDRFIRYPAWQAITSAAHNQEALDFLSDKRGISKKSQDDEKKHSPFAEALFEALQHGDPDEKGRRYKKADLTKDGVITAPELYLYLRDNVETRSNERQTPGLYPLKKHDRGEYIFHDPNFDPQTLSKADPIDETNNPYRGLKPFEEEHARFFFGRQELIENLYARIAAPDHSLTVVLGVSGSGKSSLVKAGLIPYLRELSEPEVFALNLVKVGILTSAILADVFPKFLLPLKFLPINYVHQWHILNPIRPGESPFAALARTIWAIADIPTSVQLDSLGFLSELLNQKTKQLNTQVVEAAKKHGETSRTTQRLKQEAEKFAQITTTWNQDTHAAKQQLIVEHFETLYALCQTQGEPESQQQQQLKQVFLACLNPLTERLQATTNSLVEIVKALSQKHPGVKLLLVIDQFEELITLSRKAQPNQQSDTPEEWQQFLQLLETTLAANLPQLRIIVTLRSDFEPRFLNSEALKSYWTRAKFPVRAMRSDELRQAIEGPASEMALYFEPANLVDRLIDEVGQMPGALPLLSFTLSELYMKLKEKWKGEGSDRALTIDASFDKEGGVAGFLTRRANEEYKKLGDELGEVAQQTMRRVMLRMLTLEDGETARRRVADSELVYPNPKESDRVKEVVGRWVDACLLVKGQLETGEAYVEPAHDFLVRSWDQLQEWIKDEQEALALQQRLTIAVNDWYNKSKQETEQQNLRNVWRQAETFVIRKIQNRQLNRERRKQKQSDSSKHSGERPIQYLWDDDPRLEQLKRILIKNNWFNRTEDSFVRESLIERRRNSSRLISIVTTVGLGLIGLTIAALYQAQLSSLREKAAVARNLLATDPVDGLVLAIQATGQNRFWMPWQMLNPIQEVLLDAIEVTKERDRFQGHNGVVPSVAFSPNGKMIVSGGYDGTVQLWDLQGNPIDQPLQAHKGGVFSVAFSPNGKIIVSGGDDGTVRLWDLQGNPIGQKFQVDKDRVFSVAFSPNGKIIVSGGWDGTVRLWDLQGNPVGQPLQAHEGGVFSVAFSPNGKMIVSGGYDGTVRLWDLQGNPIGQPFQGHNEGDDRAKVLSVAFSPNGKTIVSGDWGGTIKLWDLQGDLIQQHQGNAGAIYSVAFSPDSSRIVSSGSFDGTILLRELNNDRFNGRSMPLQGHRGVAASVAFSPKGKMIVSGGLDGTIRLWELHGNLIHQSLDEVNSVAFRPDGNAIAIGQRSTVRVLDLKGHPIGESVSIGFTKVKSVAFSPNGKLIVSSTDDGIVRLWKLQNNPYVSYPFQQEGVVLNSAAFSPDGKMIVSGGDAGVWLWDLQGNPIGQPFRGHQSMVYSVAFSPDSQMVASSGDNGIWLSDLQGNSIGKLFESQTGSVFSVAFSPNGNMIVSGGYDGTVRLWDLQGNPIGQPFQGHEREVRVVAYSPNGKIIVSGGADGTVRLWDLQGNPIGQPRRGYEGRPVSSIAFSPNGNMVASATTDGAIQLWRSVNWNIALETACYQLQHHPSLENPQTDIQRRARDTCQKHIWSHN